MENNVQKEEGISLMDIVRLLLSKIKLLILLVIIGGFIGGAFSVWQTKDVKYYGTQMRFYVNPENPTMSVDGSGLNPSGSEYGVYGAYGEHVFDNMVKLLNEDIFAEEMLLRSQDTSKLGEEDKELYKYLPMKDVWTGSTETELAASLNAAIDKAIPWVQKVVQSELKIRSAQNEYIKAVNEQSLAKISLQTAWSAIYDNEDYSDQSYNDKKTEIDAILADKDHVQYPEEQWDLYNTLQKAYWNVRTQKNTVSEKNNALQAANIELKAAKEDAKKPRAEVLNLWGQTTKYRSSLSKFSSAVRFSFLLANEDIKDANKFARSFIYADINVYGDANRDFANALHAILIEAVPDFVEEKMAVPDKYTGTDCQRVSRDDGIYQTNQGYTRTQAIKSAFLMAVAVGVVACVAIIIVDRSDKRLRDCDVITREFHVPILGIVPTIEMNDASTTKKGAATKQNKEEK